MICTQAGIGGIIFQEVRSQKYCRQIRRTAILRRLQSRSFARHAIGFVAIPSFRGWRAHSGAILTGA
jgi:hypothetical protein